MIKILGIDHNTHDTGIFLLKMSADGFGFEKLEHLGGSLISNISPRLPLQERSIQFTKDLSSLKRMIRDHKPDYVVREMHNPRGTKIVQMSMFTGILDAAIGEEGYLFSNGKYKKITPVEWKMVTLLDPYHEMKKKTKNDQRDYCFLFKKTFAHFAKLQSITCPDIMDAFGLAYTLGVKCLAEKNINFLNGLHPEQLRNIKNNEGNFKSWD